MSGKSLSLPGMHAGSAGARRPGDAQSRFDPPRYVTAVHVPGYNVMTSVVAARRRQDRRHRSDALREQSDSLSAAQPGNAKRQAGSGQAAAPADAARGREAATDL